MLKYANLCYHCRSVRGKFEWMTDLKTHTFVKNCETYVPYRPIGLYLPSHKLITKAVNGGLNTFFDEIGSCFNSSLVPLSNLLQISRYCQSLWLILCFTDRNFLRISNGIAKIVMHCAKNFAKMWFCSWFIFGSILKIRIADAAYALTRWQHFSVWDDVMAAILKVWRKIKNPTQ